MPPAEGDRKLIANFDPPMRVLVRNAGGADRSDGDHKQDTAVKQQNGGGICRAGVWAQVRQESFCRSCRGRVQSGRAAALMAAPLIAGAPVDVDDGHSNAMAAELASYRRGESRSGSGRDRRRDRAADRGGSDGSQTGDARCRAASV